MPTTEVNQRRTSTSCKRRASNRCWAHTAWRGAGVAGDGDAALRTLRRDDGAGHQAEQGQSAGGGAGVLVGGADDAGVPGRRRVARRGAAGDAAGRAAVGVVRPSDGRAAVLCGVGRRRGGAPLLLRLDSPDVAHVLVAGTTGSGKTALAADALLSSWPCTTIRDNCSSLIDPKGRGPGRVGWLAARLAISRCRPRPGAAITLLTALVEEMGRRDAATRSLPRLVVAVDELADLLQTGGKPVVDALTRLTQRGREAGIHVVAATPAAVGRAGGRADEGQLPCAAGGKRGQSRGCQGRLWGGRQQG